MIIKDMLVNNKNNYGTGNSKRFITIHQTGNKNIGADSIAHSKFIRNSKSTWHYTVDDRYIIRHFKDDIRCWHTGSKEGNNNSIGVELCINRDGDYLTTITKSIELVKHLMKMYDIPINNVVQHNYWSGKDCPSQIRSGYKGINWNTYINMVGNSNNSNDDLMKLAQEVIKGKFGNGEERKRLLGNKYNEVQKIVNKLLR